mmetsp:Transcript_22662/g.62918  ORF Transcript_22662/g.62918 Transcript_22662/m.62918 type:complete len:407 (-) Transcript_22662:1702-2922(-)
MGDRTVESRQPSAPEVLGAGSPWIDELPEAPVFRPSAEEFEDPLTYISSIRALAEPWGICKIVPPVSASVPGSTVLLRKGPFSFTTRQQVVAKPVVTCLDKLQFHGSGKTYSIVSYERKASEFSYRRYNMASGLPTRFVETEYWREWQGRSKLAVEYGNDVEGTAFSGDPRDPLSSSRWEFGKLPNEPSSVLRLLQTPIPGVSTPMLYLGMLFSTFAWHVEDMYLLSINFHHFGAAKTWYGVPASDADGFEQVVMTRVYHETNDARILQRMEYARQTVKSLMGKTTMFPPSYLVEAGVRVCRVVQQPGEFVITFPRSYHAGFSHGYNCGEAVNFSTPHWFPYGFAAETRCSMLHQAPMLCVDGLLCMEAANLREQELMKCPGGLFPRPNPDDHTAQQVSSFLLSVS